MPALIAAAVVIVLCVLAPTAARAQPSPSSPSSTANLTFSGGYAGFVDEALISHAAFGAGVEWVPTRRIAIGPELLYMVGPDSDRDLFVLGIARIGVLRFGARIAPFVTAGAGLMHHSDRFGGRSFGATEGAFVVGGGARFAVTPRVYVAPEFTVGWELHMRASVGVGVGLD